MDGERKGLDFFESTVGKKKNPSKRISPPSVAIYSKDVF